MPGDLSSAAFWQITAADIPGSDLVVEHVGLNPTRTGLLDTMQAMGADLAIENAAEESVDPVGDIRVRHLASIRWYWPGKGSPAPLTRCRS